MPQVRACLVADQRIIWFQFQTERRKASQKKATPTKRAKKEKKNGEVKALKASARKEEKKHKAKESADRKEAKLKKAIGQETASDPGEASKDGRDER